MYYYIFFLSFIVGPNWLSFSPADDLSLFSCDECSITFRRRDTLVRHMKNIHPSNPGSALKTSEAPKKSAAARQLSCCTATPKKPASTEERPAAPVRSHPVPVICSTGRTAGAASKGADNYVSTITKATHIVRKDESGVPKVSFSDGKIGKKRKAPRWKE